MTKTLCETPRFLHLQWALVPSTLFYFSNHLKLVYSIPEVTEARITKQVSLLNNLNPNGYSYEFTPAETTPCGTLLYIANHVSYKCHNDLNIYQKNGLESTFTEIVKPKK